MAEETISEVIRAMWREARKAAAESGLVDCEKIQALISRTHDDLAGCHPRLSEVVWHLLKLDIENDRLTPTDAPFLVLLTMEIEEQEMNALRNSSVFRITRPKGDKR